MIKIDTVFLANIKDIQNQFVLEQCYLDDISLGYDGNIYLLYSQSVTEKENLREYVCVMISLDWQGRRIHSIKAFELGNYELMCPEIQPLGENILLVGSRCVYAKNNAIIVTKSGEIIREFCLGDGIEQCITTSDGRIITGYFDEGIFGGIPEDIRGEYPIGAPGVIMWNDHGEKLWENEQYSIVDCLALNVDVAGNLWLCCDDCDEFKIVHCGKSGDTVYVPKIGDGDFLLVSESRNASIIGKNTEFELIELGTDGKCGEQKAEFLHEDKTLLVRRKACYGNKAVFLSKKPFADDSYGLYIAEFEC